MPLRATRVQQQGKEDAVHPRLDPPPNGHAQANAVAVCAVRRVDQGQQDPGQQGKGRIQEDHTEDEERKPADKVSYQNSLRALLLSFGIDNVHGQKCK